MTKAFPDADIDEHEDDVTCSYGDIGLGARSEEGSLVIEVSNTFPVVTEEELPNDWYYFKMEFISEQLDLVVRKTLLQTGHGWEELDRVGMGCPVDWGGASLTLENNASNQIIEQAVEDLEHYFRKARLEVNIGRAAEAWFVAKCQQMGLKSSYNLPMPLVPLKDMDKNLKLSPKSQLRGYEPTVKTPVRTSSRKFYLLNGMVGYVVQ